MSFVSHMDNSSIEIIIFLKYIMLSTYWNFTFIVLIFINPPRGMHLVLRPPYAGFENKKNMHECKATPEIHYIHLLNR